jgi:sugar transferase (PEP-CTERM/EpsH1 system associated)
VRILFVTSRFPHPPYRGDQVRAFHQIRLLSPRHAITLLSFREGASAESIRALAGLCREVQVVEQPAWRKAWNLARGLLSGRPAQVALYESPAMLRLVAERTPGHDVVHAQLVRMAPYIQPGTPAVLDLVDALSVNMERRAVRDRGPLRLVAGLEARRLRRYEGEAVGRARRSAVVSAADREALGSPQGMAVIPQGVDLALHPFVDGPREPETVVFTGNLGYFVNVDAACFLAREVWPRVLRARPSATLHLVGDRPAARVRRLGALPGVRVSGPVESIHAHLARARVAVAPMRTGSGMQNKVLEAMACGTPLVATPLAAAALEARDGEHLVLAEGAEGLAAGVVRLLGDEGLCRHLAAGARRLVEARFTLERSVEALERLYAEAVSGGGLPASA